MLILYNATASFYAHNSFYCNSLFLRTQFFFFFFSNVSFTNTVLFSFLLNERYHLKSSPSSH